MADIASSCSVRSSYFLDQDSTAEIVMLENSVIFHDFRFSKTMRNSSEL